MQAGGKNLSEIDGLIYDIKVPPPGGSSNHGYFESANFSLVLYNNLIQPIVTNSGELWVCKKEDELYLF